MEAPGGLAENPIGTGAFMLKEFVPGEGALLVKNPDYYLKDKDGRPLPYVDAVRLLFTKDASTRRRCSGPSSSTSCACPRSTCSTRS